MTATAIAVVAGVIAAFLFVKGKALKTASVLALIAGASITSGIIGRGIHTAANVVNDFVSRILVALVGVAVPSLIAIVLIAMVGYALWPKHKATKGTVIAAFLIPLFVATVPGQLGTLATTGVSTIATGLSSSLASLFGG